MLKDIFDLKIWNYVVLGNSLRNYFWFALVSLLLVLVFWLIKKILMGRLRKIASKTSMDIDDTLLAAIDQINAYFYILLSLFFGSKNLVLGEKVEMFVNNVFLILVVWQVIKFINVFVDYFVEKGLELKDDASQKTAILATKIIVELVIWGLAIILVLDNFGINVTSLVAGLGISGIAVALAVQNILSDLFSSFSIYFDKPFVIGDLIRYGEILGYVEKIGLKTTRLRSLEGIQVVVANKDLTNAVVENLARQEDRRVVTKINVAHDTTVKTLRKIPDLLEIIIDKHDKLQFVRAVLVKLNDFSIDFELVYKVKTPDYKVYVTEHQEVLLEILESFKKNKIEIPYPTQTLISRKG